MINVDPTVDDWETVNQIVTGSLGSDEGMWFLIIKKNVLTKCVAVATRALRCSAVSFFLKVSRGAYRRLAQFQVRVLVD